MRESEYPFIMFVWEGIAPVTPEKVVQQTDHSPDKPIKVIAVDDFFRVATKEEDWHSPEEQETVKSKASATAFTLQSVHCYQN